MVVEEAGFGAEVAQVARAIVAEAMAIRDCSWRSLVAAAGGVGVHLAIIMQGGDAALFLVKHVCLAPNFFRGWC